MDIHKNTHGGVKKLSKDRDNRSRKSSSNTAKKAAACMKVVYISTPMKVKTSASKFRAIVQELTGRESDVVRIMETSGGRDTWWDMVAPHDHDQDQSDGEQRSAGSSPASSSEEEININGNHNNNMINVPFDHEGFGQLIDPNLLYDQFCHQLDVLGGY